MKKLLVVALLVSAGVRAAPWSTRWTLSSKTEATDYYVVQLGASTSQVGYSGAAQWAISTAYALNALVYNPTSLYTYKATAGGTSASSAGGPTCTTGTCADGTVTWAPVGRGTYPTAGVYQGSQVVWRFPTLTGSGIYGSAALSVTCASSTPITPCAPSGDIQVDMQLVAGASPLALSVRTRWLVAGKYLSIGGVAQNYPFQLTLVPDSNQSDSNVTAGALDVAATGAIVSSIKVVLQSSSVYSAVTIGTPIYVDFGACSGTCLTSL